jgi:CRP-like cAMP-binding protein
MISPESLKRHAFFGLMGQEQLKSLSEIADIEETPQGITLFEEKQPANTFYYLIEGFIDLYQRTFDTYYPNISKDLLVGAVQPQEIFGLSAIVEPYIYHSTGRTAHPCNYIKFDGPRLRALINDDCQLGFIFMRQISVALTERLMDTRVQLAAAWVESQKK